MAIALDGPTKLVTLDTTTTWDFHSIYTAAVDWSCQAANMQYVLPCRSAGKVPLGGSVFTDIIYTLLNGWKLKPSGYSSGTQISVAGTLVTDDSSVPTVAPTTGGVPQWLFKVATYGVVTSVGSGLSSDEHNQLMALPAASANASAVWTHAIEGSLTAEQMQRIKLSALAGKRQGLGTATEQYMAQDGTTTRITLTPDANGNGTPTINGA